MVTSDRPTAHGVVVGGSYAAPIGEGTFEITSLDADLAEVLKGFATGIRTHVGGRNPDVVVVRIADFFRGRGANRHGPQHRLMAEGVLAATAREQVERVVVASGRDLGQMSQAPDKASLDAYAASILPDYHVQAAAAALSALP